MKAPLAIWILALLQSEPASTPAERWLCPKCAKEVPAREVFWAECSDPHPQIHVRDCHAYRHSACRTEVTPIRVRIEGSSVEAPGPVSKPTFFAGSPRDFRERAAVMESGDANAIAKLDPVSRFGGVHYFALLPFRGDETAGPRRQSVEAVLDVPSRELVLTVSVHEAQGARPLRDSDRRPACFSLNLGAVPAGEYVVRVVERAATASRPASEAAPAPVRTLRFRVQ